VGRKPSVSIAEEQPKEASAARTTVPAAASSRISPKDAEKQLLTSIPDKEREIVKGWKVKQVVITKLDNGTTSSSSVQGMNLGPNAAAGAAGGSPPMLGRLKKMGTSKMHKFTPMVTLEQAIAWLSEYGNADSSVLFENQCAFMFTAGRFEEFEDVRDDDE
jgi:hypothetical protein